MYLFVYLFIHLSTQREREIAGFMDEFLMKSGVVSSYCFWEASFTAVKAPIVYPAFTHWVTRWHLVPFPLLITFPEPFRLIQCVTWRQGQKWSWAKKGGKKDGSTWTDMDELHPTTT